MGADLFRVAGPAVRPWSVAPGPALHGDHLRR